jgi:hypothetical protein
MVMTRVPYNMTSKAARHIKLRKNLVWEWVQDKSIKVVHVAGKTNLADIFTKEMCNCMHFHRLRNSFMSHLSNFLSGSVLAINLSHLSNFLSGSVLAIHHAWQQSPTLGVFAAA